MTPGRENRPRRQIPTTFLDDDDDEDESTGTDVTEETLTQNYDVEAATEQRRHIRTPSRYHPGKQSTTSPEEDEARRSRMERSTEKSKSLSRSRSRYRTRPSTADRPNTSTTPPVPQVPDATAVRPFARPARLVTPPGTAANGIDQYRDRMVSSPGSSPSPNGLGLVREKSDSDATVTSYESLEPINSNIINVYVSKDMCLKCKITPHHTVKSILDQGSLNDRLILRGAAVLVERHDPIGFQRYMHESEAVWDSLDDKNATFPKDFNIIVDPERAAQLQINTSDAPLARPPTLTESFHYALGSGNPKFHLNKRYFHVEDSKLIMSRKKFGSAEDFKQATEVCQLADYGVFTSVNFTQPLLFKAPERYVLVLKPLAKTRQYGTQRHALLYLATKDLEVYLNWVKALMMWRSYALDQKVCCKMAGLDVNDRDERTLPSPVVQQTTRLTGLNFFPQASAPPLRHQTQMKAEEEVVYFSQPLSAKDERQVENPASRNKSRYHSKTAPEQTARVAHSQEQLTQSPPLSRETTTDETPPPAYSAIPEASPQRRLRKTRPRTAFDPVAPQAPNPLPTSTLPATEPTNDTHRRRHQTRDRSRKPHHAAETTTSSDDDVPLGLLQQRRQSTPNKPKTQRSHDKPEPLLDFADDECANPFQPGRRPTGQGYIVPDNSGPLIAHATQPVGSMPQLASLNTTVPTRLARYNNVKSPNVSHLMASPLEQTPVLESPYTADSLLAKLPVSQGMHGPTKARTRRGTGGALMDMSMQSQFVPGSLMEQHEKSLGGPTYRKVLDRRT